MSNPTTPSWSAELEPLRQESNRCLSIVLGQVQTKEDLLRVLGQYAAFNGPFGAGVAQLASQVAVHQDLFKDPQESVSVLADRSGEIAKFIKGYDEFFALIDSTFEGATSRSQVVSYDGKGWRTWWEATADNKNMYSGIVTSVNKHQLLFSTTDGVYSIPLYRTSPNPKKLPQMLWMQTKQPETLSAYKIPNIMF